MNKNYIAPRMEVAHIETASMICTGSPVPPTPKGDIIVNKDKKTTQVW